MNLFLKLFIIVSLFFMTGCTQKKEQTLKISINSWIGYAPFFYLHKTGQLQKLGFELIFNVSLAESADVYSVGKAQLVTTTQHEYDYLKK
ncbi:MAG: hypothetical protein GXO11_03245, partial [Epsilonproteobacteria bacterium]|nr:hypothetical protein [Campylobacterota bacterium]